MTNKKPVFKDAHVYYAKLARPELAYQKTADPKKPLLHHDYAVDVLFKSETLAGIIKKYRKAGVKSLEKIRYFTKEEFTKNYKCEPPEDKAYANEDGEYAILKVRKSASYNDGSPIAHPPEVVGFKSLGNKSQNGFLIDGRKTEIGNGTLVNIQIEERSYNIPNSSSKGLALDLWALQIVNLVEYVRDGLGFDDAGDSVKEDIDSGFNDEDEDEGFDDAGDANESESSDEDEDDGEWDA